MPEPRTAQSRASAASRLSGGDISHRPNVLRHSAILSIGSPVELTSRYEDYAKDKKGAVEAATVDIKREYLTCIEEIIDERESRPNEA